MGVAAEVVALLVAGPLVDKVGRHNVVSMGLLLGGGTCLACANVPGTTVVAVLAAIGKFGCSGESCYASARHALCGGAAIEEWCECRVAECRAVAGPSAVSATMSVQRLRCQPGAWLYAVLVQWACGALLAQSVAASQFCLNSEGFKIRG
jgi:MFS family permease